MKLESLNDHYEEEAHSEDDMASASFVCEDCDYRWEDSYVEDDWEEKGLVCPMCGMTNVMRL